MTSSPSVPVGLRVTTLFSLLQLGIGFHADLDSTELFLVRVVMESRILPLSASPNAREIALLLSTTPTSRVKLDAWAFLGSKVNWAAEW